jgi:hypothetical protein
MTAPTEDDISLYELEARKLERAAEAGDVQLRLRGVRMVGVDYDHDTEGREVYNTFDALLAGTRLFTWSNSKGQTVRVTQLYPSGPVTSEIADARTVLVDIALEQAASLRDAARAFRREAGE